MKILRHYNQELGIILAVFGSSDEDALAQYSMLKDKITQTAGSNVEVCMSLSSRTIMKKLEHRGEYYYTLPQQLACFDRKGYKRVVVCSVNIFPTAEHEYVEKTVNAFKTFSKTKYELTHTLFGRAKQTNDYLEMLNNQLREHYKIPNIIYMAHGAANLSSSGNQTFTYIRDYLKLLNPRNFMYTIEGSYKYQKNFIEKELEAVDKVNQANRDFLVVPLLLVAGNHYKNDVVEIKEELESEFNRAILPDNFSGEGNFCLLKLPETLDYFEMEVLESIKKVNW